MKRNYTSLKINIIFLYILFVVNIQAQTTVSTLSDLKPYLKASNANVKLAAGTYTVAATDISAGLYPDNTTIGGFYNRILFLFEGNDSTYDFTDVTINIETGVFAASRSNVHEIQIIGNNNVLKNLTIVDVGSVYDDPINEVTNIAIDGRNNRIEGFHMTTKGSKPYGYGDTFGKGAGPVIAHNKHSSINVRGESNHVLNCTIIHRSFGHAIYMQAASYPKIEGCYIEGELRTTDDILLEEGTGSAADNVNFMTDWGYKLPAGYMLSTGEAGIRAYNVGRTIIDGVQIGPLGASNVTVLNCTIKHMRTAVTLGQAGGTNYIEGCTSIGNEQAFAVGGGGSVVNCYSDAVFGPVYKSTYNSDSNAKVDITLIPPVDAYYNGNNCVAYIGGSGHDVILKTTDPNVNPDLKIQMGGFYNNLRMLNGTNASQNNHYATNLNVVNSTEYPIEFPSESSGNTGSSCGPVTDNGSGNFILGCGEVSEFPAPNVAYYIGNNRWSGYLSADGSDETGFYLYPDHEDSDGSLPTIQEQWVFVPVLGEVEYYYVEALGAGDDKKRLMGETVGGLPQMVSNTTINDAVKWKVEIISGRDTYYLINKLVLGNGRNIRLLGTDGSIVLSDTSNTSNASRFAITVAQVLSAGNIENIEKNISLYPIPASDVLNIRIKNYVSAKVEIINLFGQIVISKQIQSNNGQINLSNISDGVYIAKIYSNENIFTKKIVKN
ncbi:T9SS type A sorting domain-containing protein [uncultured Polaribacter sp.]|uniref:T9SS type A sorting domain-containing protein n=1 Tax=uncultured Polaribacter sp. TaxID=174711 RepID=UPI0026124C05|nr:T9SS type A sorting domain-containing protein [uncultured Polaribacter sp.]